MTSGVRAVVAGFPRRVPAGRPGDLGLFPPGSVARRVNGETRLLLGGPRALLLQLAHPSVAAGVADHSGFLRDPFGRLWNTLDLTLTAGFGDEERRAEAAARVQLTHARVTGERDGRPYRALDPELLAWVHATLVDTAIETYAMFVRPIGPAARERYVREMDAQAEAFGVPRERLGRTYRDLRDDLDGTVASLDVSEEARTLAAAVLRPDVTAPVSPVTGFLAFVTAGLLPARLRPGFGLRWSPRRDYALRSFSASIRASGSLLPDALRRWPHAREADARLGPDPEVPTASAVAPTRIPGGRLRAVQRRG